MAKIRIVTHRRKMQAVKQNNVTIHTAWQSFMLAQHERGNSPDTIGYYERFYKKLCKVTDDGKCAVSTIAAEGFQTTFTTSIGDVSIQTVNSYLRGLRAFGRFCMDKGYFTEFDCPIKEVDPPLKQVYTQKELKALCVKPPIEEFAQYRNYIVVVLLLATGMRAKTVINLRISDVDLEEGYINLNTTKSHKVVRIGLERKAQRELAEYISYWRTGEEVMETDYLICNAYGEQMTRSGLAKAIATYNQQRGVEKTSIHLFRHTFAKNWITSGGDIISLAHVLTHSELEMVKRYANLYGSDVKDEIAKHSVLSQIRTASGMTLKTAKRKQEKQRK